MVTPCVGVWIETCTRARQTPQQHVTPCVGVWIETLSVSHIVYSQASHPAWVCGLKPLGWKLMYLSVSHTLRGCVD